VNLHVEPGEFFALLGPSGSGKSTLLRLIAGFNRHQHGEVLVDGRDVSPLPPWQRNIGMVFQNMVFQNYALWPHMTVWDNVAFGLVERRADKASIRSKVGAALELVGLASHAQRRPNQLSGGHNSVWRWPAPSSSNRRCCCWTNRCPTWTRPCACRCARNCWPCSAAWA